MMLKKKQAMLYEAVGNIDSRFIEEAITAPVHFTPRVFKRAAAIAAMLTIILAVGIFLPTFGSQNATPYLSISANAVSSKDSRLIPIDYDWRTYVKHFYLYSEPVFRPHASWGEPDLFKFSLKIENVPARYLHVMNLTTKAEISYNNVTVRQGQYTENIDVDYQFFGDSDFFCDIHGWFTEDTILTIRVYVNDDDERILYQTQTVKIIVSDGYMLEVLENQIHENIDWSEIHEKGRLP